MATSASPDRTGLGSAPDIDEAPPRLVSPEDASDESEDKADEGLVNSTFPGAVSAVLGATDVAADGGTVRLVTTNDGRGSAGGEVEDRCPIYDVTSANAGNADFVAALQDLYSAETDEEGSTVLDDDVSVEEFFHQCEVDHDMVVKGVAETLDIPKEQAQCVIDKRICWPASVSLRRKRYIKQGVFFNSRRSVIRRTSSRLVLSTSK